MRQAIYDMWNVLMNAEYNPLRNIPSQTYDITMFSMDMGK